MKIITWHNIFFLTNGIFYNISISYKYYKF